MDRNRIITSRGWEPQPTQHTMYNTQHTANNTQHAKHNTQPTSNNKQHKTQKHTPQHNKT